MRKELPTLQASTSIECALSCRCHKERCGYAMPEHEMQSHMCHGDLCALDMLGMAATPPAESWQYWRS